MSKELGSQEPVNTDANTELTVAGSEEPRDSVKAVGKRPWLLELRSNTAFIQATVAVAVFTDIFLYGLIIPVFPFALESRVGINGEGEVQRWVSVLIAIYGGGTLVASPIAGYIADHTETRRSPLLVGLLALAGATLMLCLGRNITTMVFARLLQGISAAIVWSVGLALMVDTVGTEGVGKAMGFVGIALSLGILLAPLLGGVVYDHGGYYAVFAMAFALLGLDIILRVVLIEKKVAEKWIPGSIPESQHQKPDEEEDVAETQASTEVVEGNNTTSTTPAPILAKIKPNIPPFLLLLTKPRLLTSLFATLVLSILMTSLEATLPLHVHLTFNFTPTKAGLLFLAITIPTLLAPPIGYLSDLHGPKLPCFLGFLFATPLIATLPLPTNVVGLCVLLALLGVTFTAQNTPIMAEITYILVDLEKNGQKKLLGKGKGGAFAQGYGLFNVAFSAGTMIGPLWAGFVTDKWSWKVMGWSLAILCGITLAPVGWYTGGVVGQGGSWWERKEGKAVDEETVAGESAKADEEEEKEKGVEKEVAGANGGTSAGVLA